MGMASKHVVVLGGGFGGLSVARALAKTDARVTIIDRRNHHVFQPLLYQVATAGLSPADISAPIRAVVTSPRADVLLASVTGVDTTNKRVLCTDVHGSKAVDYDYLVIATGARHSYFGHDDWEKYALGLKSIEDATALRRKILLAFEAAESEQDDARIDAWLTFVVVGGGPTGVELAGAISELARRVVSKDFRRIDPKRARVILVEAGPRLLSMLSPELSQSAKDQLQAVGVIVKTDVRVLSIDAHAATTSEGPIATHTVLWAAGVKASPAGDWLSAPTDAQGRVNVDDHCRVPGKQGVFVIGDTSTIGAGLPGIAPVAMQQGRYVAELIAFALQHGDDATDDHGPFRYVDKGNLATIGRGRAVGEYKGMRFTGFVAWLVWALVHVYYLIGFRSRALVLFEWAWAYVTFQRGARLIVGAQGDES
jgi:NADH:ubiquinone reductase (H+-translocating)